MSKPKPKTTTPRGRPKLADDQAQTARIAERVTQAQLAEYQTRGGKAWLVRELARNRAAPPSVLAALVAYLTGKDDETVRKDLERAISRDARR